MFETFNDKFQAYFWQKVYNYVKWILVASYQVQIQIMFLKAQKISAIYLTLAI